MSAETSHLATVTGRVTELFGHRFAVATSRGKILADLGPKGLDQITLAVGDEVTLSGEQKPSELKVHDIKHGGRTIRLPHGKDKHEPHGTHEHDPETERRALAAVMAAGFEPIGAPRRKQKHFEIDARRGDEHVEFHVEHDGRIRKTKPAEPHR